MNTLTIDSLYVFDGEPRIRDVTLATHLGYSRPHDIRQTIDRNISELEAFGVLRRRAVNSGQRGRPGTETFLNEPQALLICMFARTPLAAQARKTLIDVFMAWRAGKTVPVSAHHRRPASPATQPAAQKSSFNAESAWQVEGERYWFDFDQLDPAGPVFVDMCIPSPLAAALLQVFASHYGR